MTVAAIGFGRRVDSAGLQSGDVAIVMRGTSAWVAMRIVFAGTGRADLLLAQVRGEPQGGGLVRLVDSGLGDYTTVAGRIVARTTAFALPTSNPVDGALTIDARGTAFIRTTHNGIDFYEIGGEGRGSPEGSRAYFNDWELVQLLDDGSERLIAKMAISDGAEPTIVQG